MASRHVAFGMAIIGEFPGAQMGLGLVIATAQNNFTPTGAFARCSSSRSRRLRKVPDQPAGLAPVVPATAIPVRGGRDLTNRSGSSIHLRYPTDTSRSNPQCSDVPLSRSQSRPASRHSRQAWRPAAAQAARLPAGPLQRPPVSGVPTVTMMAGGIDKQIDLSCQLVQDFGCSKQCGVRMVLATKQNAAPARCITTGSPAP